LKIVKLDTVPSACRFSKEQNRYWEGHSKLNTYVKDNSDNYYRRGKKAGKMVRECWGVGHEILNRVVGRHHSAGNVVEKTRGAERVNHADTWRNNVPQHSKCKCPEVGVCLMFGAFLFSFLSASLTSLLNSMLFFPSTESWFTLLLSFNLSF